MKLGTQTVKFQSKVSDGQKVERLARLPEWKNDTSMEIAQAALGNTKIENEIIVEANELEAKGNGERLSDYLTLFAMIGTPHSLRALCLRLRSPLSVKRGDFYEEPIPLFVIRTLRYAFPEEGGGA